MPVSSTFLSLIFLLYCYVWPHLVLYLPFHMFCLLWLLKLFSTFFPQLPLSLSFFPPFLFLLLFYPLSTLSSIFALPILYPILPISSFFFQILFYFCCFSPVSLLIHKLCLIWVYHGLPCIFLNFYLLFYFGFSLFLPLSSFLLFSSTFFLFSSFSSYPTYTNVMISSVFLTISLLFSSCCFSFLFPLFFFLFFSFLFCLFSSHSSSFLLFQPSFPCSLASLNLNLASPCSSSSSVSTSFLFPLFFSFFPLLFSFLPLLLFLLYPNYTNVMISSIFLVISWERCSLLPHFIHSCIMNIPLTMAFVLLESIWRESEFIYRPTMNLVPTVNGSLYSGRFTVSYWWCASCRYYWYYILLDLP